MRLLLACVTVFLVGCVGGGSGTIDDTSGWELHPGDVLAERPVHPFVEQRRNADGTRDGLVRPLWRVRTTESGRREVQFVAPLGSALDDENVVSRIFWPLLAHSRFGDEEERSADQSNDDTWLFPIAVWGDDPDEGAYLFVLPVGGTLKSKFFADEIVVRGFPFWIETTAADWESTHVLWPLIAWGDGPERSHRRALPFFSRTDGPGVSRRALLWPLLQWATEQRGERTHHSWFAFPLLGRSWTEDGEAEQWTALFPFFDFAHDERTGYVHRSVLWPLHEYDLRPGASEKTWWFPFWGEYHADDGEGTTEESSFALWPVFWNQREDDPARWSARRMAVPLWMRVEEGPTGGGADREEHRSWPLVHWRRDERGTAWQVPAILPTFGWDAGEDLYERTLVLFRSESDPTGRWSWELPLGVARARGGAGEGTILTLFWFLEVPLDGGGDTESVMGEPE